MSAGAGRPGNGARVGTIGGGAPLLLSLLDLDFDLLRASFSSRGPTLPQLSLRDFEISGFHGRFRDFHKFQDFSEDFEEFEISAKISRFQQRFQDFSKDFKISAKISGFQQRILKDFKSDLISREP